MVFYSHGTGSTTVGNRANYFSSIYATKTLAFMNLQYAKADKKALAYTFNHPYLNNTNSFRGSIGTTSYGSRASRNRT
jgi:hypothetical protein